MYEMMVKHSRIVLNVFEEEIAKRFVVKVAQKITENMMNYLDMPTITRVLFSQINGIAVLKLVLSLIDRQRNLN